MCRLVARGFVGLGVTGGGNFGFARLSGCLVALLYRISAFSGVSQM